MEFNQSNVQHFDNVSYFSQNGNYALALETLSAIDDTNSQESALKAVLNIYSNRKINAIDYTSSDTTYLDSVALCNSLLTGDASFMSRNILFKEVHDGPLESNLRRKSSFALNKSKTSDIKLFPNPTINSLYIHLNSQSFNGNIAIYDNYIRLVKSGNAINGMINISSLKSGQYILKVINIDGEVYWKKFQKIN